MLDGTYRVVLKTPMGAKEGELRFQSEAGTLIGSFYVMDRENPFFSGSADGENFTFSGDMETAVGKLTYYCVGRVDGDALFGTAKTRKGDFPLTGIKTHRLNSERL